MEKTEGQEEEEINQKRAYGPSTEALHPIPCFYLHASMLYSTASRNTEVPRK